MILMVDNYDSFTYNLVQMLAAAGAEVEVLRNDAASAEAMLARQPRGIVLSPGPGRPEDAGVCLGLLRLHARVPLLGVCLGHQALRVASKGFGRPAKTPWSPWRMAEVLPCISRGARSTVAPNATPSA